MNELKGTSRKVYAQNTRITNYGRCEEIDKNLKFTKKKNKLKIKIIK